MAIVFEKYDPALYSNLRHLKNNLNFVNSYLNINFYRSSKSTYVGFWTNVSCSKMQRDANSMWQSTLSQGQRRPRIVLPKFVLKSQQETFVSILKAGGHFRNADRSFALGVRMNNEPSLPPPLCLSVFSKLNVSSGVSKFASKFRN